MSKATKRECASLSKSPVRQRRADQYCARCRALNIKQLFKKEPQTRLRLKSLSIPICTLGIVQKSMLTSRCPLCRIFAQLLPGKGIRKEYTLNAFSTISYHFPHRSDKRMRDTVVLSVAPANVSLWKARSAHKSGVIYMLDEQKPTIKLEISGNTIEPLRVDYKMARNWVHYCRTHHKGYCKLQGPIKEHTVAGFKLIDCKTRRIVPGSQEFEYVALSYVWGENSARTSIRLLPNPAPRTIEDAIIATTNLGFRYLWIDRYCISQIDPSEKHHQIARMDRIYADAIVTIVAAAGEDPHYGLPGVSRTHRHPQPSAVIGKQQLVSSLRSPRDVIMSSKWASRGWTFQEAKLSRRAIFFTDDQIFFECASMSCQETVTMPLEAAHQHWSGSMGREHDPMRIFPPNGPGRAPSDILETISAYTLRHLSYPADNLNGILGIFNSFKHGKSRGQAPSIEDLSSGANLSSGLPGVFHLWGIPIISDKNHCDNRSLRDEFCHKLVWQSRSSSVRSPDLPSWSWTGWVLPIKLYFIPRFFATFNHSCVKIRLRTRTDKIVSIRRLLEQSYHEDIIQLGSQSLIIKGVMYRMRFFRTQKEPFDLKPIVGDCSWANFWPNIQLDTEESINRFVSRAWEVMIFSCGLTSSMLVLDKKGSFYERVGVVEIDWGYSPPDLKRIPKSLSSLGEASERTIELR